jgi:hypothetical protein
MARDAEVVKAAIVSKALKCIDEVYPNDNALNKGYFPTDAFIDEVVRWVVDAVPTHTLTERKVFWGVEDGSNIGKATDKGCGVWSILLPSDFGRLVYFNIPNEWERPVFNAITENSPRYLQQKNRVLRGNPSRPVVAIVHGNSNDDPEKYLEWYTSKAGTYNGFYVPYDISYIPSKLEDLAAWKLAEVVLVSMSDAQSAAACTSKVTEHLQMLAL